MYFLLVKLCFLNDAIIKTMNFLKAGGGSKYLLKENQAVMVLTSGQNINANTACCLNSTN